MPPTSAAMELKVLISVLQSGQTLQNMLGQVNQLSQALGKLQQQANAGGGGGLKLPPMPTLPPGSGGLGGIPPQAKEAEQSIINLDKAMQKLWSTVRFLTGGFLALQSVRFVKNLADTAARAEVLQTTLHVVATNAGVTASEIDKIDRAVQRMGITAASSRQSLTQMMQAKLDVSWAPKLARAAQDLAVVSGMNSSATFQRLLLNIQQMDALGLRWMGVMVSREQAEQRWAAANNTTVRAMTRRQQVEAFMIETHKQLLTLEGAYAASMDNVAKQIASLERLTETLKQTLGDVLLPTYSALVAVLGEFYEELIVVARVSTANRTAAEQAGDAARKWATSVKESLIAAAQWLRENIEWVKQLVKWIVEIKLAIMGYRALVWIGSGAIAFLTFLTNTIRAIQAFRAGTIGLLAVLDIMKAKTTLAGIQQLELAAAHRAAAVAAGQQAAAQVPLQAGLAGTTAAANTATAAVSAFWLRWLGLAGALAIPIVAGIMVKIKQEEYMEGFSKKTPVEQFNELREKEAKGGTLSQIWQGFKDPFVEMWEGKPDLMKRAELRQEAFEAWMEKNKQLIEDIEKKTGTSKPFFGIFEYSVTGDSPVAKEFRKVTDAAKQAEDSARTSDEVYQQILEKRREIETIQSQVEALPSDAPESERQMAAEAKKRAEAELQVLQAKLASTRQTNEQTLAENKLIEAMRNKTRADREKARVEEDPDATREQLDAVRAAAKEAGKLKEQAAADLDTVLTSTAGLSVEAARDKRKQLEDKTRRSQEQEFADEVTRARKALGLDKFSFVDGTELAEFAQGAKAFETLLDQFYRTVATKASAGADQVKAAAEQNQQAGRELKEGLKALSGSVTQESLPDFRKRVDDYRKATGDTRTASQALARAQINARREALAFTEPIVAERRELIELRTDKEIQVEEARLAKMKTLHAAETEATENLYRQNLVSLEEYYRQKIAFATAEAEQELVIQSKRIQKLIDLEAAEVDSRKKQALQTQIAEARSQYSTIAGRLENEITRLRNERDQRRRTMEREIESGLVGQAAQFGGEKEARAQLEFQLEQDRKKYAELNSVDAERLLTLKRLAGEAEIAAKFREREFQLAMGIEDAERRQLDARQRARSLEAAKDRVAVDTGQMTTATARNRENARIEKEMEDNRRRAASAQREVDLIRDKALKDEQALRQKLEDQKIDAAEIDKQVIQMQQEHNRQIDEAVGKVEELDEAYVNLKGSIRTAAMELQQTFADAFARLIEDQIFDIKAGLENLRKFGETIGRKIVSEWAKEWAGTLAKKIGDTGFFGIFFKGLGLNKPDGTSPDKALWMQLTPEQMLLLMQSGGQGGQGTYNVSFPNLQSGTLLARNLTANALSAAPQIGGANLAPLAGLFWNLFGGFRRGTPASPTPVTPSAGAVWVAEGGVIQGPGTGTSDSIPAMVSTGEHIMPAAKTAQWLPLLEGIRTGKILPFAKGGVVQSIAIMPIIPRHYAGGGVVTSDAGAAAVQMNGGGNGNMTVSLHPEALNMTMRDWLEHEVARQHSRR